MPLGDLGGFRLYYGLSSGNYSGRVDTGTNLQARISDLQDGVTYYFAATAVSKTGVESTFSEEIHWAAPAVVEPALQYALTVRSEGSEGVAILVTPEDENQAGGGVTPLTRVYGEGAVVTLIAPEADGAGMVFDGWAGVDYANGTSAMVMMAADRAVGARYRAGRSPFGGQAWPVPGTIQIEDFDEGGEGKAYHDTTVENEGGSAYRAAEGVDIRTRPEAQNGQCLIAARAGEWLEYTADVAATGLYVAQFTVAMLKTGGTFHLEVDGVDVTGPVQVSNTGGWYKWKTVQASGLALTSGRRVLRVVMDSNGPNGAVGVFDAFRLDPSGTTQALSVGGTTPFGGTARAVPGTIQVEDFDNGGEGAAYHDTTAKNEGFSSYRTGAAVDIRSRSVAANGQCLIAARAGEWLVYTVDVVTGGLYTVTFDVSMLGLGGIFHMDLDGEDATGALQVPDTGGWYTWRTVQSPEFALSAGRHLLRVWMDRNGPGGAVGVFDEFHLAFQAPMPDPEPAEISGSAPATSAYTPLDVRVSSFREPHTNGWSAVDGDETTMWSGAEGAGGWWIVLAYEGAVSVGSVDVLWGEPVSPNAQVLASTDARTWFDLQQAMDAAAGPVQAGYLWFILPDEGDGRTPSIREIAVR